MKRFARTLGFLIATVTTIGAQGHALPDAVEGMLRHLAVRDTAHVASPAREERQPATSDRTSDAP